MRFEDIIQKLDRPVPRYTSYPPATYFNETITPNTYHNWLQKIESNVSLYIHIPFCQHLCRYCGCHTLIPGSYEVVQLYLSSLHTEIDILTEFIPSNCAVTHIHFGGGTPSFLKNSDLKKLFQKLFKKFKIKKDADIAIEIDPRTLNQELVNTLVDLGINRVSLGIQDFNPQVQKAIGRIQPFNLVQKGFDLLRKKSLKHINVDMMYGLPLQTETIVAENIEKVLKLAPSRCALFGYAHVPWFKQHQQKLEAFPIPDALERYKQFSIASDIFNSSGYESIGIDHFAAKNDPLQLAAKNKTLHRNFQGYTLDKEDNLIGLGASAISSLPDGYVQNSPSLKLYKETLADEKTLPIIRGFALKEDDKLRRSIIESLMCFFEVNLNEACDNINVAQELLQKTQPQLQLYEKYGLVHIKDTTITISKQGRYFTRLIAECFDTFGENNKSKRASRL